VAYQDLLALDIVLERIILTMNELEQKSLDLNQANARIQISHHVVSMFTYDALVLKPPYKDEITQATDLVLEAYGRWWRGKSDAKTLRQEIATVRESFQPLLKSMRAGLLALDTVDMSFEQTIKDGYGNVFDLNDQVLEYDGSNDIFLVQREHRMTVWGVAPVLGTYTDDKGYTAPDDSFNCNFAYSGMDGELLYDFIFPDRTLVAFTNDWGLGQAVERRPLAEPPADAGAARKLVEELFKKTLLPTLKQQHSGLKVLQQKWVDKPRSMLQIILYLPQASLIGNQTESGITRDPVVRGLWIFVEGDGVYSIIYQGGFSPHQDSQTDAQRIKTAVDGLSEIQQTCTYR
jgi:hypothetical protein